MLTAASLLQQRRKVVELCILRLLVFALRLETWSPAWVAVEVEPGLGPVAAVEVEAEVAEVVVCRLERSYAVVPVQCSYSAKP